MIKRIAPLDLLFAVLQRIPYVASKNHNRIAHHFLNLSDEQRDLFIQALMGAKHGLQCCSICAMYMQKGGACVFCADASRNKQVICVVEQWYDVLSIEKTDGYKGLYHVLGGLISPLEGISAGDLTLDSLLKRIKQDEELEIVLALSETPEGEATIAYIEKLAKPYATHLFGLARGMPVGGTLDSMDRLTIFKALMERRRL